MCIIDQQLENKFPIVDFDYKLLLNELSLKKEIKSRKLRSNVLIIDLLTLELDSIKSLRTNYKTIISLSPVFNHFEFVDILFSRFKYLNYNQFPNLTVHGDLKYTIVNSNHNKIIKKTFEQNLKQHDCFNVAISMGGADADNLTLSIIKTLLELDVRLRIWVVLGEGYQHSIDEMNLLINTRTIHDFVYVKSKVHFWEVIRNCNLGIFAGGVTMYESLYMGLPSINFTINKMQFQLLENEFKDCLYINNLGEIQSSSLLRLKELIIEYNTNRSSLLKIHSNVKKMVDGKGTLRIVKKIAKLV